MQKNTIEPPEVKNVNKLMNGAVAVGRNVRFYKLQYFLQFKRFMNYAICAAVFAVFKRGIVGRKQYDRAMRFHFCFNEFAHFSAVFALQVDVEQNEIGFRLLYSRIKIFRAFESIYFKTHFPEPYTERQQYVVIVIYNE